MNIDIPENLIARLGAWRDERAVLSEREDDGKRVDADDWESSDEEAATICYELHTLISKLGALLLTLAALSACSSPRVHVQTGLIDPGFGATDVFRSTTEPLSAVHTSIQLEGRVENEHIAVTLGAGPSITTPIDGRSSLFGAEVSNRIQWKATRYIQPYFYHAHGVHYHDGHWQGSDVRYEFSTRFSLGLAFPVSERAEFTVDYGWMHFSNGMTFHGDKTRQLFGLPKATENLGFEAGAVFVGFNFSF